MFPFAEKIKTNKKLAISIAVLLVLVLGIAGYFFWNKAALQKTEYVIPGVPYSGIYNHKGNLAEINPTVPSPVISIGEYWSQGKSDPNKLNGFFRAQKGSYTSAQKIKQFFDQTGGYDAKVERLEIKDLKKYINPETRTPLLLFLPVSSDQPTEVTFYPATLLIGIKEAESKLVFHDYWFGNNYEMTFDEFNKRWEKMRPDMRNLYLVVQPSNLKDKLNEMKNKTFSPYPGRTLTMQKTEQIFKDYSIAIAANWVNSDVVAKQYFLKTQNDPNFEEFFPPLFKVLLWGDLGNAYAKAGDFDNALNYANKAIEADHGMDDPSGDWPGYEHPGKSSMFVGVISDPYRNLGNIYWRQGNLQMAQESYQKAIAISPNDSEAAASLQEVQSKLQKK